MRPEILAPAGDQEMLSAAIAAGADAVYFGVRGLNMRANSRSFEQHEISSVVEQCHASGVKAYLTLNTIIYEHEIPMVKDILRIAKDARVDALICWDHSVISLAHEYGLEIHVSTQASISNSLSAEFYKSIGASRCVLAREVTLEELKELRTRSDIQVEVFAHGAMCVSVSGRCFMSEQIYGKSANRGECIQPCRRSYDIQDPETDEVLRIEDNYVLSPKDLCILPFLEKVAPYVDALKIEGRGRSPEYVKVVTEVYREALDLITEGSLTEERRSALLERLRTVYNRDFSSGFYMGRPIKEFTDSYGSKATRKKVYVGYVKNFYRTPMAAEIVIEARGITKGEQTLIIGPTTGVLEQEADSIMIEDSQVDTASKGQNVALKTDQIVRKNDKVYVWENMAEN